MPSPELERLAAIGKLKQEPPVRSEFEGLVRSGAARLVDAENEALSVESRFDLAYGAAHALALAALRWHGFRSTRATSSSRCFPTRWVLQPPPGDCSPNATSDATSRSTRGCSRSTIASSRICSTRQRIFLQPCASSPRRPRRPVSRRIKHQAGDRVRIDPLSFASPGCSWSFSSDVPAGGVRDDLAMLVSAAGEDLRGMVHRLEEPDELRRGDAGGRGVLQRVEVDSAE